MQHPGRRAKAPRQTLVIIVTAVLGLVLTAGGVILVIPSTHAAPALQTVKSGTWSDPAVWSDGRVPQASEPATIAGGTTVTVAGSVQAAGVTVDAGGRLTFDPNSSAT